MPLAPAVRSMRSASRAGLRVFPSRENTTALTTAPNLSSRSGLSPDPKVFRFDSLQQIGESCGGKPTWVATSPCLPASPDPKRRGRIARLAGVAANSARAKDVGGNLVRGQPGLDCLSPLRLGAV